MIHENWTQRNAVVDQLVLLLLLRGLLVAGIQAAPNAGFDSTNFERLVAIIKLGTLAGAGSVNFRWQHCSASASTDSAWADVDSTSCITSTFLSGSNNKIASLELALISIRTCKSSCVCWRFSPSPLAPSISL